MSREKMHEGKFHIFPVYCVSSVNANLTIVTCAEYLHVLAVLFMPYMGHII